jgi:hypothetical protein
MKIDESIRRCKKYPEEMPLKGQWGNRYLL